MAVIVSAMHSYSFIARHHSFIARRWRRGLLLNTGLILTFGTTVAAGAQPTTSPTPAPKATSAAPASAAPASAAPASSAPASPSATPPSEATVPAEETAETAAPEAEAPSDAGGQGAPRAEEAPSDVAAEGNETPVEKTDAESAPAAQSDQDGWMKLDEASAKLEEKQPESKPFFRTMLLVEGIARYGGLAIAPEGTSLEDEDTEAIESSVGNLGGQITLGVMPGGSAFTMAGRLRGGSYVSETFTRGNVAAEMLFGANFGRNARGNEFTHILGGFGVEFLPGENQDLLTMSVAAATVVKGVSFGGGLFLGANDEIAIGTLGMQIGWGQLF